MALLHRVHLAKPAARWPGWPPEWLQALRRGAMVLFYAMAAVCAAGFGAIFVLPRPWIAWLLVGSWICIGLAALALLAVHVIPGDAESLRA